jgi:hypothetical protein
VARRGVLIGDAVKAMAANGIKGGNDFKVREDAPSTAPELHMSDTDIRPCLIGDEKSRSESSPAAVEVTCVIHGGGQGSGPMIPKTKAKGAQGSEDHLCKRIAQWLGQSAASWRRVEVGITSALGEKR